MSASKLKTKTKRERLRPAFLGMKFTKSKSSGMQAKSGAKNPTSGGLMSKKAKARVAASGDQDEALQDTLIAASTTSTTSSHESHGHGTPKPVCAVCGPTPQKVFDILHGVCLLAVLATSVWNVVLTVQGKLDVQSMIPIFVTLFFAMLLLLPSQVCGGVRTRAPSAWLSVCGSSITVIATGILVGYLIADPAYQPPIGGTRLVEVDSNNLVKTHVAMPNGIGFGTTQLRVTK